MSFEKQAKLLTDAEVHAISIACESEICATEENVSLHQKLAEQEQDRIPVDSSCAYAYADRGTCMAALKNEFSNSPWDFKALQQTCPLLHAAVNIVHRGPLALRNVLYPEARLLVPFALMFACYTRYSPETLLCSNLEDYGIEERLGQKTFVARAYSSRAEKHQIVRILLDETVRQSAHPAAMFTFLQNWTGLARGFASPLIRQRLFLFLPRTGSKVMSFDQAPSTWFKCLESFRCEHNLPAFSLTQIRRTMVDLENK